MAATSKADLIALSVHEFGKLAKLLAQIEPEQAVRKRDEDTSIKDVVAHRAHWIDLFLGWYQDGQAGVPVHFPAEGYKWNDLKRYNAELRQRQAELSWTDATSLLEHRHTVLVAFIEGLSDAALYGGPMKGARNDWTTGRWAEAAGPSHYRSAAKYIRAELRRDQAV